MVAFARFRVLNFDVQASGLAAALPMLIALGVKLFVGPLSDKIPVARRREYNNSVRILYCQGLGDKARILVFSSVSQYAMAACFLTLALLPAGASGYGQLFYTGCIVFRRVDVFLHILLLMMPQKLMNFCSSLNIVGVNKSVVMISGRYSYPIFAWIQACMRSVESNKKNKWLSVPFDIIL